MTPFWSITSLASTLSSITPSRLSGGIADPSPADRRLAGVRWDQPLGFEDARAAVQRVHRLRQAGQDSADPPIGSLTDMPLGPGVHRSPTDEEATPTRAPAGFARPIDASRVPQRVFRSKWDG